MTEDDIIGVEIDHAGRLCIKPSSHDFAYIYRAGMEVGWDAQDRRLCGPKPRDWTYARWYEQITAAAAEEYGVHLRLTPTTTWINVPDDLRSEIIGASE